MLRSLQPKIVDLKSKKLVATSLAMSLQNDATQKLWQSFMPQLKSILHKVDGKLYNLIDYSGHYGMHDFTPNTVFTKIAAVEVLVYENIPEGLEKLELKAGKYAVFGHIGNSGNSFSKSMEYIFKEWLPNSGYAVDNRLHFEVLGAKYKNNSDESEEEIWVPVKM